MSNIKTALSVPENLFTQVNELAKEMNVSRSRVFVLAVEEFIERHQNRRLIEKINAAYSGALDVNEEIRLRQTRRIHRKILEQEW
jgi:metal-responsive CopG/Arc/MetJ family transcriptional regulator